MTTTPLRFITSTSLFDGHDAAINIMRRLIQQKGAEVIHLGHNRSVDDVVKAALQEDADAIAISSYQGGHNEFFRYLIDRLNEEGIGHVAVFGGGGGTITPEEITELEAYGVERLYHPNDTMHSGLVAMIDDVVQRAEQRRNQTNQTPSEVAALAQDLSAIERGDYNRPIPESTTPVIGLTGTGGSGKSSLTDELLNLSGSLISQQINDWSEDVITGDTFDSQSSHGREELILHIQSSSKVSNYEGGAQ